MVELKGSGKEREGGNVDTKGRTSDRESCEWVGEIEKKREGETKGGRDRESKRDEQLEIERTIKEERRETERQTQRE